MAAPGVLRDADRAVRAAPSIVIALALAGCSNEPPSVALVHLEPALPVTTDDLHVVIDAGALDLDGDDVTYHYAWKKGGVGQDVDGDTVPSDLTRRFDVWTVDVTADDGQEAGLPATASVTVQDAAPVAASVTLDPPAPAVTDDVTCLADADDADGDDVTWTWSWYASGKAIAFGQRLAAGAVKRGEEVYCEVVPFDGQVHGDAADSPTVRVGDSAPSVDEVELSSTAPKAGQSLWATVKTSDPDGDRVSVTYAWYVGGALVADDATLPGGSFVRGDEVWVVVTPSDGELDGAPFESAHVTVADTAPVVTSVSISPTSPSTGDTLTATVKGASDADGDAVSISYAWTVSGKIVQSGASDTLDPSLSKKHDDVTVTATPSDGTLTGTAETSTKVTVLDTAPTMTSASLSPTSSVYEDTTVRCTGAGFADADGDTENYRYQWYVDGKASVADRDIDGASFSKHQTIYCVATAWDGETTGNSATSGSVTVENTPPGPVSVSLSPATWASPDDDLVCDLDTPAPDADGDAVTYVYAWTLDGVALSETSSTLAAGTTVVDGTYTCSATPYDSEGAGYGSGPSAETEVVPLAGEKSVKYADVRVEGATYGADTGGKLAVGDWNGDGSEDLLVGNTGGADAAWVFLGPLTLDTTTSSADVTFSPATKGWYFGRALASAGDFDGDGKDDVLVGQSNATSGTSTQAGEAYLFTGGALGSISSSSASLSLVGKNASDQLGYSVAGVGDEDGDGLDDVLVGALQADISSTDAGGAYLLLGSTAARGALTTTNADAQLSGENNYDQAGYTVAGPGDVDGDGYDDLLVGARMNDTVATDSGAVYLVYGPVTGKIPLSTKADATFLGTKANDNLGWAVAGVGDLDGDGHPDVGMSASASITVYLFEGAPSGKLSASSADAILTGTGGHAFGSALSSAGDYDGDGLGDLFVGAYAWSSSSGSNLGAGLLFYGPFTGTIPETSAAFALRGETSSDEVGVDVLAGHDLDDDGVPDLVVGAPYHTIGGYSSAGAVYLLSAGK